MHKVFINDKPLIFENVYQNQIVDVKNYQILSESQFSIDDVLKKINEENTSGIIYLCARHDQVWNNFAGRLTLVEAAGGLVQNDKNEFLIIFRKKRWDLPKGKLDYDETPEGAAIREVKEECGINNLEIGIPLIKTFHTYLEKGKNVLKKTHWYHMTTEDADELKPQVEEEIEKAFWMNEREILQNVLPTTYSAIKDVLRSFIKD